MRGAGVSRRRIAAPSPGISSVQDLLIGNRAQAKSVREPKLSHLAEPATVGAPAQVPRAIQSSQLALTANSPSRQPSRPHSRLPTPSTSVSESMNHGGGYASRTTSPRSRGIESRVPSHPSPDEPPGPHLEGQPPGPWMGSMINPAMGALAPYLMTPSTNPRHAREQLSLSKPTGQR